MSLDRTEKDLEDPKNLLDAWCVCYILMPNRVELEEKDERRISDADGNGHETGQLSSFPQRRQDTHTHCPLPRLPLGGTPEPPNDLRHATTEKGRMGETYYGWMDGLRKGI